MNPREEIEIVRRRIGALEHELHELQRRVAWIETSVTPGSSPAAKQTASPGSVEPPRVTAPLASPALESIPFDPPPLPPAASHRSSNGLMVAEPAPTTEGVSSPPLLPPSVRANPLREWLEPLQLWPPSGEENAEVRLGAWWATRLGALLAVVGIVFLGIYVSREAPPWVRLAEVTAVTAGVIGLGALLERRLPKFGAVVFGAGLALAYFCAFAAYAVRPMKVITNPIPAAVCELVVVAVILGVAWRRNSNAIATMAVALGHVTAFLALRANPAFGPCVVLSLSSAAIFLRLARGWDAPSALAMPLAWLFLLTATLGRDAAAMPLTIAWIWTGLYFALFVARDWMTARRGQELSRIDRTFQITNSTLAVAVGWAVTVQSGSSALTGFYFACGIVSLAAALLWRRFPSAAALVPVFVCKASGLIALGVIAAFEGHARSLVLLAQAFVMLVSARTSGVRGLRIATLLAGAVALAFYLGELQPGRSFGPTIGIALEVIFLVGASAFVASFERWLSPTKSVTGSAAILVGAVGILTASGWSTSGWAPAVHLGLGALLSLAAIMLRGRAAAAIIGGLLAIAAHGHMWSYPASGYVSHVLLWSNEAVLLAGAAVAVLVLSRRSAESASGGLNGMVVAFSAGTFVVVCFKAFLPAAALAATAVTSALLVALADRARGWPLAVLSTPLLALGGALYAANYGSADAPAWLWVAAALAWSAPVLLAASPERSASIRGPDWRAATPALQTALATGITILTLQQNVSVDWRVLVTALLALAVFGLARRPGLRSAVEASWVFWGGAVVYAASWAPSLTTWAGFGVSWLPAIAVARWNEWQTLRNPPPLWRPYFDGIQTALAAGLGLIIAFNAAGVARLAAFAAIVLVAVVVLNWGRVRAARVAVAVLAAAAWLAGWFFAPGQAAQGWGAGLLAVLGLSTLVALVPFLVQRDTPRSERNGLRWVSGAAALLLAFHVLLIQKSEVAAHATAACAVMAVAMFLMGLFGRSRPHRLTGLVGLAFCVVRAFVVDLDSTLHRIIAFVALGVVLLWVGFSYHRFRHLVVDEKTKS